ncbi:NUDIX domain-containing protein [Dehalococcoidia bacterium]|nr:NUDIX domain-containing protein [Dehalococcoidia bacterium]
MNIIFGETIGKNANLAPSCCAVVFDPTKESVLLTRRSDNGRWCLPGGAMQPGESAPECCARELLEETGLVVRVGRLIGLYSDPHVIYEYLDGNRIQGVTHSFEAEPIGGEFHDGDETTEIGYFSPEQMKSIDVMEEELMIGTDAFAGQTAAFVR